MNLAQLPSLQKGGEGERPPRSVLRVRHQPWHHSAINEVVKRALVSAGVPAIRGPRALCRAGGKRPDGMTMTPFRHGKALLWDATVSNTLALSHILGSTAEAGRAASEAEWN
ncbi:hypothetical protein BV898_13175 [Hypsibius exemplaris]|uniref:Uncharacterized protein n=1 Tax=Hypsibius exemplaris TaxID=2072580 RepID=A0A1W0WBE6_HYPEX|nr:hypothetical protein BV898_13175 [Hypsibius exemplaris]